MMSISSLPPLPPSHTHVPTRLTHSCHQVDDQHLPDTATDATKVIQAWLLTLLRRHPKLAGVTAAGGGRRLDVHVTGHSLGGLLSEVVTVESTGFAARHGAAWHCTSFESPGLPDL